MSHQTHRTTLRFAPILLLTLAQTVGFATVAHAGGKPGAGIGTESVEVTLADLNLATPEGQVEAQRRLAVTAKRLCREVVSSRHIEASVALADCIHDALTPAMAKVSRLAAATATPPVALSSTKAP